MLCWVRINLGMSPGSGDIQISDRTHGFPGGLLLFLDISLLHGVRYGVSRVPLEGRLILDLDYHENAKYDPRPVDIIEL